jgi:hypothetical protein
MREPFPKLPSSNYNSDADTTPDFKFELLPLRSPLLRQSLLVSFPPLIDMLKFSGYSYVYEVKLLKKQVCTARPIQASFAQRNW